ncbi:MAG TPA: hypothetical protein VK210_16805, partial [Terriglobia bacterium]|nr:hypothetical protein [Terriglobia bacterium]
MEFRLGDESGQAERTGSVQAARATQSRLELTAIDGRLGNHVMDRFDVPPNLLDLIYDAASDPQLWCTALSRIADLMNSRGGILFGVSMAPGGCREVHFEHNGGMDEACGRAHRERHPANPWSAGMYRKPVECVVLSDEIVPLRLLQRTSFYDEVLHPQDAVHNAMVSLAARDDFRVAFNMCRSSHRGPFEESERQFLNRLVPHLNRSLLLGFRLDGYRMLQQEAYHALDRLAVGVILLDRRELVVYANRSGQVFGAAGRSLQLCNERLETVSYVDTRRLNMLIRAAMQGAPVGTTSLRQPVDGSMLTVLVTPVRSRDIDRFGDAGLRDAAVIVFIIAPGNRFGV